MGMGRETVSDRKNNWCFIFARSFGLKHKPSTGTTYKRKVNTNKKWMLHTLCYSLSSRLLKNFEISTG